MCIMKSKIIDMGYGIVNENGNEKLKTHERPMLFYFHVEQACRAIPEILTNVRVGKRKMYENVFHA